METVVSDQPTLCSNCNQTVNARCGGRGYVLVDGENGYEMSQPCPNVRKRQVLTHLGPELASVKAYLNSPLYDVPNGVVKYDGTKRNLYFNAPWPALLPHFKWALYAKGHMFHFRVVTDTKIKTVFVGDDQYKARPTSSREEVLTFNNLDDLIGADIELAIIKLGYLGHKNAAAAGALKEALLLREVAQKPTWIIEDTRIGYEWRHSRSEDVAEYIDQRFDRITLPIADGGPVEETDRPNEELPEVAGMSVEDHDGGPPVSSRPPTRVRLRPNSPAPRPERQEEAPPPEEDMDKMMDGFLSGNAKKPKFKRGGKGGSW